MRDTTTEVLVLSTLGCVALLGAHFATRDGGETKPANEPVMPRRVDPGRSELDDRLWQEWREKREPSVTDSRDTRDEKAFTAMMQSFRQQPVEVVEDESGVTGIGARKIMELATVDDIRRVLEEGGEYTGPLPPELVPVDGSESKGADAPTTASPAVGERAPVAPVGKAPKTAKKEKGLR